MDMVQRIRRNLAKETHWRKQLARQAASGLSIAGWCRRHKISIFLFNYWKRTITRRDECLRKPRHEIATVSMAPVSFARVRVSRSPKACGEVAPIAAHRSGESLRVEQESTGRTSGNIEILLSDGLAVRIAPGFDEPTLGRVLEMLRNRSC
jgi:hypothetical protein